MKTFADLVDFAEDLDQLGADQKGELDALLDRIVARTGASLLIQSIVITDEAYTINLAGCRGYLGKVTLTNKGWKEEQSNGIRS